MKTKKDIQLRIRGIKGGMKHTERELKSIEKRGGHIDYGTVALNTAFCLAHIQSLEWVISFEQPKFTIT